MTKIQNVLKNKPLLTRAVVCYLVKGDRVLLGLRKKVSLGLGKDLISGIGGKVGNQAEFANETYEQALIREVQEEIEVTVKTSRNMGRVRFLFPNKPKWNQDVTIYIVDSWEGVPQETTPIKPIWFPINSLPVEKMWDDNKHWLPRVLSGKEIDAVFLYGKNNNVSEYKFYPV